MSNPITFGMDETSEWLISKGWGGVIEPLTIPQVRDLVDDASADGLFGDVIVELHAERPRFAMITVTIKNPGVITRVATPDFDATDDLTSIDRNAYDIGLSMLVEVAEKAAAACASLTSYVVSWTSGYEAPSFSQHTTLAGAKAQVTGWINDNNITDEDQIHILDVSAGSPTVTVVAVVSRNDDNEYVMVAGDADWELTWSEVRLFRTH